MDLPAPEAHIQPHTQSARIRRLFQQGQPLAYNKNEIILGNDHTPDGVYYIDTGYIKSYSISDDGDEYLHLIYGPGEIVPIIWSYLGIEPEGLFFETISECTLWRISRDWFSVFIQTNLDLCYAMSLQLAQQFQVHLDRLDNLEYKKANQRVAYRILFLASRFGVRSGADIVIDVPITHEDFANSINLARESVTRQIAILEHEDILKRNGHRLVIHDLDALLSRLSRPISIRNWRLG